MNKEHTKAQGGPCTLKCCRSFGTKSEAKRREARILRRRAKAMNWEKE